MSGGEQQYPSECILQQLDTEPFNAHVRCAPPPHPNIYLMACLLRFFKYSCLDLFRFLFLSLPPTLLFGKAIVTLAVGICEDTCWRCIWYWFSGKLVLDILVKESIEHYSHHTSL